MNTLNIAFIWHMHQPLYKDRINDNYLMPWVRLHGIKDYLDMAVMLERYPNLSQTFNMVPSLIEQLEDYAAGKAKDPYWKLSKIPVNKLSMIQKAKILELFFDLVWEKMIYKFPRYLEILKKREHFRHSKNEYVNIAREFSDQEILDLTVWFNLAWFDYLWQKEEPELATLISKGRDFSEEDRKTVLHKQIEIIRRIIPEYKKLLEQGTIEITTSPYYHPILPLLCDTDSAKVARPGLNLPEHRYQNYQDACNQIKKGIDKHISCFGWQPDGMWPSEQSVSPEILPALAENNIKWIVSDEGILFHSLRYFPHRDRDQLFSDPTVLYQPYLLEQSGRKISIVFRDIYLSDAIGFVYARMDPYAAAAELYNRLKAIQYKLPDNYPYLVTIALDGENCWEHYVNDGYDFLNHFYEMVSNDSSLNMTSVNKYLEKYPPQRVIDNLFSGSWIRSDFTTWIGDPTKNKAWDFLYLARKELISFQDNNPQQKDILEKAWEEIYIAEGSDWFWWFGEGNSSSHDDLFDWQFRLHLQNVYRLIDAPVPEYLDYPLYNAGHSPAIPDALFKEGWIDTHVHEFGTRTGTMHQSGKVFEKIYYGHDQNNFRLRIDFSQLFQFTAGNNIEIYLKLDDKKDELEEKEVFTEDTKLQLSYYANFKVSINLNDKECQIFLAKSSEKWQATTAVTDLVFTKDFINIKIPYPLIHLDKSERFSFIILAWKNAELEEAITEPIEYQIFSGI
jgi:alpha-amylase/alpha-mannosidase (GH57 family)